MEPLIWTWCASVSLDVAFYVLFAASLTLTAWTPCPVEDDPARLCAEYERGAWILVGETPGLSLVDSLPDPPAGGAWLIDVQAVDQANQVSAGEGPPCES